ncbi:MAG: hypothetical protein H6587_05015, partial [Flavobacteriales bacterium]|nr:hypothetical protein [Flavobacteriales bacterium]
LNAVQALEFRKPLKTSPFIQKIVSAYRKEIPFVTDDVYMHPAMEKSIAFVKEESSKLSVKEFLVGES